MSGRIYIKKKGQRREKQKKYQNLIILDVDMQLRFCIVMQNGLLTGQKRKISKGCILLQETDI